MAAALTGGDGILRERVKRSRAARNETSPGGLARARGVIFRVPLKYLRTKSSLQSPRTRKTCLYGCVELIRKEAPFRRRDLCPRVAVLITMIMSGYGPACPPSRPGPS